MVNTMGLYINITLFVFYSVLGLITADCHGKSDFQKLPKPMKFSTFRDKIAGQVGQVMYQFESPRWPIGAHRLECVSTLVEPTNDSDVFDAELQFKFRQDGVNCVNGKSPRIHVDDGPVKYAVFDEPNPFKHDVDTRLFFFSSHPTLYALVFLCMDKATIMDGECQDDFTVDFNIFYNVPNMVAWKHMARDLEDELGLTMMDTRMRFLYLNDECPGAPTRENHNGDYYGG